MKSHGKTLTVITCFSGLVPYHSISAWIDLDLVKIYSSFPRLDSECGARVVLVQVRSSTASIFFTFREVNKRLHSHN